MSNSTDKLVIQMLNDSLTALLDEDAKANEEKREREAKIKKTKLALEAFGVSVDVPHHLNGGSYLYNEKHTWKQNIIAYIKYKGRAVKSSEIIDGLKHYVKMEDSQLKNIISGNLNELIKNNRNLLFAFKPDKGKMKGYYYAIPEFFDDGKLKKEHKPY